MTLSAVLSEQESTQNLYEDYQFHQGSHRLEKYLNLEGFLEKSLKIKYALKSTRNSCKGFEMSLKSSIFCRN